LDDHSRDHWIEKHVLAKTDNRKTIASGPSFNTVDVVAHASTMKFFTAVVAAMLSVAVAFTPAAVRPNTRVVSSRTAEASTQSVFTMAIAGARRAR